MTGKQKCHILRQIRRDIAAANQLDYHERDCTHEGPCRGTCPYCEAELRKLEKELTERRSLGRRVAVMGLSMGLLTTNLASCDSPFGSTTLQGDMAAPESSGTQQVESVGPVDMGEVIAAQTTTESPETEAMGEASIGTLMGDVPVYPPDGEITATTTTEPMTTELMGTFAVPVTQPIAAGVDLPDPDTVNEPVTIAVTEPLKTP